MTAPQTVGERARALFLAAHPGRTWPPADPRIADVWLERAAATPAPCANCGEHGPACHPRCPAPRKEGGG